MKIKDIAFVCCAVSDMSRARAFYEGILGLKLNAPVGPDPYSIRVRRRRRNVRNRKEPGLARFSRRHVSYI
jgi:catechol 2,3-dioxygenase-like lactoylglutathione lyase family enzyme